MTTLCTKIPLIFAIIHTYYICLSTQKYATFYAIPNYFHRFMILHIYVNIIFTESIYDLKTNAEDYIWI